MEMLTREAMDIVGLTKNIYERETVFNVCGLMCCLFFCFFFFFFLI